MWTFGKALFVKATRLRRGATQTGFGADNYSLDLWEIGPPGIHLRSACKLDVQLPLAADTKTGLMGNIRTMLILII